MHKQELTVYLFPQNYEIVDNKMKWLQKNQTG